MDTTHTTESRVVLRESHSSTPVPKEDMLSPAPVTEAELFCALVASSGKNITTEKKTTRMTTPAAKKPAASKKTTPAENKAAIPKPAAEKKARVLKSTPNNIKRPMYPRGKWSPSVASDGKINKALAKQTSRGFAEIYYVLATPPPTPPTPFEQFLILDQKLAYLNLNHGHPGQHRPGGDARERRAKEAIQRLVDIVARLIGQRFEYIRTVGRAFPPENVLPNAAELVQHLETYFSCRKSTDEELRKLYWPVALKLRDFMAGVREDWKAQEGLSRQESPMLDDNEAEEIEYVEEEIAQASESESENDCSSLEEDSNDERMDGPLKGLG